MVEKRKDAYSRLQSCSCRRWWCRYWWSCRWVRNKRANHKSMWQRYGVWGLGLLRRGYIGGSDLYCGGGLVLTHYLITWLGNGRSTRHSWRVITLRPGALLENFFMFHTIAVHLIKTVHFFGLGKTIWPGSIPGDILSKNSVHPDDRTTSYCL